MKTAKVGFFGRTPGDESTGAIGADSFVASAELIGGCRSYHASDDAEVAESRAERTMASP